MKYHWSRRAFVVKGAKSIAVLLGVLTFGKFTFFAKALPPPSIQKNNHLPFKRVLVAFDSQFGSTREVADAIGLELSQKGFLVFVKKIKEVSSLSDYDKVVLGSAIQYDKWMPEAREFAKANKEALGKLSVSCFFTCLVLSKGTAKSRQKAAGYALKIKELVPSVKEESIGQFSGVLDYGKMSFGQRLAAKALFAIIGVKEGDYRDWERIRDWASDL